MATAPRTYQIAVPLLTFSATSAAAAITMTARLQLIVSGVSVVNAIGLRALVVSAEWIISGGVSAFSYNWSFELPVASASTSAITRTFSAASGDLRTVLVSAVVSDASGASVTSAFLVHLRYVRMPAVFDGRVQIENQAKRRLFPT